MATDFHAEYFAKKRHNRAKAASAHPRDANRLRVVDKKEADTYRLRVMEERRGKRIEALSQTNRDFRRYLRTLDNLLEDEDVDAIYSGVLNVDLGDLVSSLPRILQLEDRDRFLLVEETHRFIRRIERRTYGPRKRRGYVRGDFGFDLPKGETYTLADVKAALRLH